MTPSNHPQGASVPAIAHLLTRYLTQHSEDEALETAMPLGEVELYQASDLLAVSPQKALTEAWEAALRLVDKETVLGLSPGRFRPPSAWSLLVRRVPPRSLVPCCVGVFPQVVRDPSPLLAPDRRQLFGEASSSVDLAEILPWGHEQLAQGRRAEALFAVGMLRLAGDVKAAQDLLEAVAAVSPPTWADLLTNERAATAWFLGDLAEAGRLWAAHRRQDNGVVLFNRGVTALCQGQPDAVAFLGQAAAQWPENSPWHHLALMYRVLAEGE